MSELTQGQLSHAGCSSCHPNGNPAMKEAKNALDTIARHFQDEDVDWDAETIDAVASVLRMAGYKLAGDSRGACMLCFEDSIEAYCEGYEEATQSRHERDTDTEQEPYCTCGHAEGDHLQDVAVVAFADTRTLTETVPVAGEVL